MKTVTNIIVTHAAFLALFGGAALAFAQDAGALLPPPPIADRVEAFTENQEEKKAQFEEKKEEMAEDATARREAFAADTEARQEQLQEKREEMAADMDQRRAQLQERTQERITNLAANVSNRMEAAVTRIQDITDRTESRIEKLSELGMDTSEAEAALASAQLSIDAAVDAVSNIDAEVSYAVGSEDARAEWKNVRVSYTNIGDYLKTAHAELRATIAALKEATAEYQDTNGVSEAVRQNQNDTLDTPEAE